MKPAELVAPLTALKDALGEDNAAAMDAIIGVVARFSEADVVDLVSKLGKLKPAARRAAKAAKKPTTAKKADALTPEMVDAYAARLVAAKDDATITVEILSKLRPTGVITPAQLRQVAKSLGISSTSKTTKAVLFASIEGAASQAARDRGTAQNIREGA